MFAVDTSTTIDALESELIALEALIGRARARQVHVLRQIDEAQVAMIDGSRSMVEWTSARLDIQPDTARTLNRAVDLFAENTSIADRLASGDVTFDRAVAVARLATSGADADLVAASDRFDLAGINRLASRHRRMTRTDERKVFVDRFVATQSSLDGGTGRFWGQLPGFEFTILQDALDRRADQFRDLPGPASPAGARRADALVSLAQDSVDPERPKGDTGSRVPLVTVFVDAERTAATAGEAGAEIQYGPKIGPATLERIRCTGAVQIIGLLDGRPIVTTDATRPIPPAIRRFVAWRDGGCTIDGCNSLYRLEPHHIRAREHLGDQNPDNLTTLCWHHHHVKIHGEGFTLDPHAPPQRRRLLPPARGPDPPPG
jgi:hypothetical protein